MERRTRMYYALAAVLLGLLTIAHSTGAAQSAADSLAALQAPGTPAVIRVSSNLVMVPVSVTDDGGKPVDNLQASDFKIEEDNIPEAIAKMAEPGQTQLDLVLLFDVSGSVSPRFEFEQEAAAHFLQKVLQPGDLVSIISIAAQPQIVQRAAGDVSTAIDSLYTLKPTRDMTAFFDSVVEAAQLLRQTAAPGARRVAVVISDGEDNNSERAKLADALLQVQRADCIFYAINPAGPSIRLNVISLRGQAAMQSLAEETGGFVFLPQGLSELQGIFTRISAELRAQYLLGYYSSNTKTDGAFRRIVVTVPGKPDLRIRARQGYYAPLG